MPTINSCERVPENTVPHPFVHYSKALSFFLYLNLYVGVGLLEPRNFCLSPSAAKSSGEIAPLSKNLQGSSIVVICCVVGILIVRRRCSCLDPEPIAFALLLGHHIIVLDAVNGSSADTLVDIRLEIATVRAQVLCSLLVERIVGVGLEKQVLESDHDRV